MSTLVVSGTGTGVGKTVITAALAALAAADMQGSTYLWDITGDIPAPRVSG